MIHSFGTETAFEVAENAKLGHNQYSLERHMWFTD